MLLKSSFQILSELLSKCYREQLVGLWLGVKSFLRVCDMCLSLNWYNLFGYCVLYSTRVQKMVCLRDLYLKDTKLLSKLP